MPKNLTVEEGNEWLRKHYWPECWTSPLGKLFADRRNPESAKYKFADKLFAGFIDTDNAALDKLYRLGRFDGLSASEALVAAADAYAMTAAHAYSFVVRETLNLSPEKVAELIHQMRTQISLSVDMTVRSFDSQADPPGDKAA
jgi:hypothetical protein